uniref:Variant erythrocyte surface antigen-1, beta subunit n=1 Tax=Babesia bovis TaxID=5865 RepID=A7ARI3_BABBO|eukprot:XP_001610720.1 variant erythrocyte surface antigen-1, beta subunit [Babesia bovis T2Bo]
MSKAWAPYGSLTQAPTNLKEAIDWVLRVTGKDGKQNVAKKPASTSNGPHCLCYLAKAVKDLLYDARSPGTPGPHPERYWDGILLTEEQSIVKPVLQDLGLLGDGSTGAASSTSTCAGGTEVIKALIDHLALGLQMWVGWQEGDQDKCCLKGEGGKSTGIGRKCDCNGSGVNCCSPGGKKCHDCTECGPKATEATKKCYLSAYCKPTAQPSGAGSTTKDYIWTSISTDSTKVHLLARIFLGSVCLIWSGLSQLGFLTGNGSSTERWKDSKLHEVDKGLGSFMAAMGYDLERLNGSGGSGKKGADVWKLLSGTEPSGAKGIQWKEFASVKGASQGSVAEYYSSIYSGAKTALTGKNTEEICTKYPLLVLHILASGYFRAGSAGAKGITSPPKAATSTDGASDAKKDTTSPRKPRTIREILYWLSALPYSKGYKALVERMGQKFPEGGKYSLEGTKSGGKTDLHKDNITHYLLAACGYCPLVLIGIQGTIEREVKQTTQGSAPAAAEKNKCPHHKKNRHKRCDPKDIKEQEAAAQAQSPQQPGASTGKPLGKGEVCYGGYHLEVSKFGPLHGMYANGLFGFHMDLSAAQCLDQLRIYVYHCFYQLYFLRKQCKVGVGGGVGVGGNTVLGWQSCRYGKEVKWSASTWLCSASSTGSAAGKCKCMDSTSTDSPLMSFLCDGPGKMVCNQTIGRGVDDYPPIETHWTTKDDNPKGHFGTPDLNYPKLCPVPMGWSAESGSGSTQQRENHFKGSGAAGTYPAHCTGNTLSLLLEYHCDPEKCHGTLVVLLRLLACITPTVPRTLGDLFGFYYYIVYIGGKSGGAGEQEVNKALGIYEQESKLHMMSIGGDAVVEALKKYGGDCSNKNDTLKCLYTCPNSAPTGQCSQYLSPLSGQQYGQLSPAMAGTYLSWLVYLIGEFQEGLDKLKEDYMKVDCKSDGCTGPGGAAGGCGGGQCQAGTHGNRDTCCCTSVVSCTGVLPVLYKYGFGYGDVEKLHKGPGVLNGGVGTQKKCHDFLETLKNVEGSSEFKKLINEINQLIYTTRLPWIFVLTIAWLVAVLYLAFGAIWPLDWTHMRSHCRGWFRKGSLSPWEVLMVGKKKGRGILEFFGKT